MRARHYALTILVLGLPGLAPTAAAQTCDAYFARSQALSAVVNEAYGAMSPANPQAMASVLPRLEAEFNKLPASEVKAEVCVKHINAYTDHQFAELNVLRTRNADSGFPANLPLVKQPDLNHAPLAYAVGWIKYEQGNFEGALAAYAKGLAMFPHNRDLENEYLATLMQLKRNDDVLAFSEKMLANAVIVNDQTLGKVYAARAVAQMGLSKWTEADDSFTVSLRYENTEETRALHEQLKATLAAKKN